GSSSTGSYSLSTASAIRIPPARIIGALPAVKLVSPWVSSGKSSEKSMYAAYHCCRQDSRRGRIAGGPLITVAHQHIVMLDVLVNFDLDRVDSSGARGADHVLHLHRFEHAQFLPGFNRVAGLDRARDDHARKRREHGAAVGPDRRRCGCPCG